MRGRNNARWIPMSCHGFILRRRKRAAARQQPVSEEEKRKKAEAHLNREKVNVVFIVHTPNSSMNVSPQLHHILSQQELRKRGGAA